MNSPLSGRSRYLVITSDYLVPGLIIFTVLLTVYLIFATPLFSIKNVVCTLNYEPCPGGALAAELNKTLGQNLLTFDPAPLARRLTSGDFHLEKVQTAKELPSTLRLVLVSNSPVVAVRSEGDPRYLVIDKERRILGLSDTDPRVPVLYLAEVPPFQIGTRLPGAFDQALVAALALSSSYLPITRLALSGSLLQVTLESGQIAVLDVVSDHERQISLLQAVLKDQSILEGITQIDVRFSQPVLK